MENNNSNVSQDVGLTEDHILMTVGDIFGAGVETTSTVLKWAVAYLLHYPEVSKISRFIVKKNKKNRADMSDSKVRKKISDIWRRSKII